MNTFSLASFNVDLLTFGITAAAIATIGFIVFFSDRSSTTGRTFLRFSIATILYSFANYLNYQNLPDELILWLLRFTLFFALWHAYSFFSFAYAFPSPARILKGTYHRVLLSLTGVISLLTLTPFVFSGIAYRAPVGQASRAILQFGMAFFAFMALILVIGGIYLLGRHTLRSKGKERVQSALLLLGVFLTFLSLVFFNVILPVVFLNTYFLPFAPIFFFPLVFLAAYALFQQGLLHVKVAATEILTFILAVVTLIEVVYAQTVFERVTTFFIFALVVIFGILLIQSVIREIFQREEIQILADNLKIANEKLKELDKLKSQFLSIASHDLRAPLTIIRNFISLLLEGTYGKLPAAGQEGLQQVFDRATDMAKSVDTYLNVSRIEQGKMKYDFIDVELLPLVKNAIAAFKTNAEKKNLTVHFTASPELEGAKAKLDVAKINEVLNNLLDNSIKYTPQGSIVISAERRGTMARITIKDTGIGMSKETIGKLFQLFSTSDDSRKVNVSSTGVGLYITKAHVEAHGGKIWAESEGEGKGSTFNVELPVLS